MNTLNYKGKKYTIVPELVEGSCHGCALDDYDVCPNNDTSVTHQCWDEDSEGNDVNTILIHNTKKALAAYVAAKLGASDDPELE